MYTITYEKRLGFESNMKTKREYSRKKMKELLNRPIEIVGNSSTLSGVVFPSTELSR
jgi:hypothetical protein